MTLEEAIAERERLWKVLCGKTGDDYFKASDDWNRASDLVYFLKKPPIEQLCQVARHIAENNNDT